MVPLVAAMVQVAIAAVQLPPADSGTPTTEGKDAVLTLKVPELTLMPPAGQDEP